MPLPDDYHELMPRTCPIVIGARLFGLGVSAFKSLMVDTGKIATDPDTGKLLMHSLASALGHPITHAEFLGANRSLDGRREGQRKYAARKRSMDWKPR